jgi:competence ComEA-like helix-hairpin-helix protein
LLNRRFILAACYLLALIANCICAAGTWATTKKPPVKPININTANSEELQQVPGIGPVTAEKILQMRKSYGAFKSVDDLLAIKGLGRKRLEKMRKYLTVGKAAASAKPATKPTPADSTQQSDPRQTNRDP